MKAIVAGAMMVQLCAVAPVLANQRIQLVEHEGGGGGFIDLGEKGDSAGDLLTFANPVYDQANKVQLGVSHGFCLRVVAKSSWECVATLILEGGQITIEGPYYDAKDSLFVVTGGAGKYAGAKGEMKLHSLDTKPETSSLDVKLL
jgi:allene oxide cyclase